MSRPLRPGALLALVRVLPPLFLLGLLAACDRTPDPLADARRSGELVVLTRFGSATYHEGRDGPDGYEHALASAFARHLGLRVRFVIKDSIPAVLWAVEHGEGHLAAAGLTRTPARERHYRFGPDYKEVRQQVVCNRTRALPESVEDLAQVDLLVLAGSSYEERLDELRRGVPGLTWRSTEVLSTDEILERVWRAQAQCTVADSNLVAINRRYFPELAIAFPIGEPQQLAWVLPPRPGRLARALADWFDESQGNGLLERIDERYYGHVEIFDYVDVRRFIERVRERLPRYQHLFEAAARKYSLPWKLLAAVAYQESHWDPRARSPTGVRGMMMLTLNTAFAMGVQDRLDPQQSITGGARYLARMLRRVPEEVTGPDRLWFALAAYNVGLGHVLDARDLARRLGKDPNTWHSLKSVLPLLSRKQYYRTVKHGYARGSEPVRYLERVRNYLDILERGVGLDEQASAS